MIFLSNEFLLFWVVTGTALISLSLARDLSKPGAILWGLALIGTAGWLSYRVQYDLLPSADGIAKKLHLANEDVAQFKTSANIFLLLVPFITAAWGTNLISDAIARDFSYRAPWKLWAFVKGLRSRLLGLSHRRPRRVRLDSEGRTAITRMAQNDLFRLLETLPQFCKGQNRRELLNMQDGSVVTLYQNNEEIFVSSNFLRVRWPGNDASVVVDALRFMELHFLVASKIGASDLNSLRKQTDELLGELYD